jgi:UDP-glucose:glycoprotein glucosyltransferase
MYPGALPAVKANLFNIVLVLDLSYTSSLNFISGPMSNILNRDLPIRFGVVPQVESADGALLLKMLSADTPDL